jgi:hypothetical protein
MALEGIQIEVDFGLYRKTREVIYSSESEALTRTVLIEAKCPCGSVTLAYQRRGSRYTVLELSDYGKPTLTLRIEQDHRPWQTLLKTKIELGEAEAKDIWRRMQEVGSVSGFIELIHYVVGGLVYGV